MKKLLIFFSILIFSSPLRAEEVLRMGYFMLQPHTFNDGGHGPAQGAGIKYFEEVAKSMGYKVEWVGPLPLPRLTKYLKSGKVDGTIGFPKFASFEKFLHYTDKSVYQAYPSLGVSKVVKLSEVATINDITGFRIGFVKSKSGKTTPLIDANRDKVHLKEFHSNKWMQQSVMLLSRGRLEAVYDRQEYTMRYIAKSLKLDDKIKVLRIKSKPGTMHIVFSRKTPKDGAKLTELCNEALGKVEIDYKALLDREFESLK